MDRKRLTQQQGMCVRLLREEGAKQFSGVRALHGDGRERRKADAGLKEHILRDSCCLIQSQPVFRMMTEPLQMAEGNQLANHIVVRY